MGGAWGALLLLSIEGDRAQFVRTRRGEFFGKGLGVWGLGDLFWGYFKPFGCQVVRASGLGIGFGPQGGGA